MMFLASLQGFFLAFIFCLVALLAFAAGVRLGGRRRPSLLEDENDRLASALCDVAGAVERIAIAGAVGPVRKVYTIAVDALGLPNKAPVLEPDGFVPAPRLPRARGTRAGTWGRA
jgi:hypothetical protein